MVWIYKTLFEKNIQYDLADNYRIIQGEEIFHFLPLKFLTITNQYLTLKSRKTSLKESMSIHNDVG